MHVQLPILNKRATLEIVHSYKAKITNVMEGGSQWGHKNELILTVSRKMPKILTVSRKSHYLIETLKESKHNFCQAENNL